MAPDPDTPLTLDEIRELRCLRMQALGETAANRNRDLRKLLNELRQAFAPGKPHPNEGLERKTTAEERLAALEAELDRLKQIIKIEKWLTP